jgi:hypothetical protein
LLLFNLLDGPDTMIGVNNLLAYFEAHHITSIELQKSDCAAGLRGSETRSSCDANLSVGSRFNSHESVTSGLEKRQGFAGGEM